MLIMWQVWLFIAIFTKGNLCVTWRDVKNDYETLINSYTGTYSSVVKTTTNYIITNVVPTNDHDQAITVYIALDIFSVTSFDAVAGRLDILGSVKLRWQDDIPRIANPFSNNANVQSIMVDYTKIWTPTLILLNSANSVSAVGNSAYKVRFFTRNGTVTWSPRVIMAAACTPDVSYFPFDQQECDFILTTWSRDSSELVFSLTSNEWGMSNFDPSNVWEVIQTRSELVTVSGRNAAKFTIVIKRYSLYFAFNIVLPILLLALLSGFLFMLPVDSGERVGFAITCFLSFAVLLQTIMSFLPETSTPMSLLCYYVIVMVLFSGLLSIINILILKVYLKPEGTKVPRFLVHFIELIQCTKFKRCYRRCRKTKVASKEENDMTLEEVEDAEFGTDLDEKLSKDVASRKTLDTECGTLSAGSDIVLQDMTNAYDDHIIKNKNVEKQPNEMNNTVVTQPKKMIKSVEKQSKEDNKIQKDKHAKGSAFATSVDDDDFIDDVVDWYSVGKLLDFFFLLAFFGVQGAFTVFFLIPLGTRY